MIELIPEGSEGKVWFVSKDGKEIGWSHSLEELTDKFGREDVVYGMRWYFPKGG